MRRARAGTVEHSIEDIVIAGDSRLDVAATDAFARGSR